MKLDKWNLFNIAVSLVITIACAMAIGMLKHWALSVVFIILFFVVVFIQYKILQRRSNKYMRQAHFTLALFCRAENNRKYLNHHVELRCGYLAKWIEFILHDTEDQDTMKLLKKRWEHIKNNMVLNAGPKTKN